VHFAVVVLFMLVLPVGSLGLAVFATGTALTAALLAKWFVVGSVGARLSMAGLRQIIQPRYTAKVILSLQHEESLVLVRELGFANLALGLVGLACWLFPAWVPAAALAGAVFYCFAGFGHVLQHHRNKFENAAMVSDLFVGLVLAAALVGVLV